MAYDADLVLKGKYSDAYVDVDTNDATPTTLAANSDGNSVIDLGPVGTGAKGLDCVVILHDTPTTYTHTCVIVIQDSEHLTDGWHALLTFPILYCYLRELIVTSTTAFIGTDIDTVLTGQTSGDTGVMREFSRNLLTVGETGKIFVEMQAAGDLYDSSGEAVNSAGTGRGTMTGVSRVIDVPLILVRRFSTPKRYIRCSLTVTAAANFGDMDILVTGSQHSHVNNLYH